MNRRKGGVDGYRSIEVPAWHAGLALFKHRDFLLFLVASIGLSVVLGIMSSWASAFLHRAYGLPNREASAYVGYFWLFFEAPGAILGGLLGSYLRRRFSAAYTIQLGLALLFAAGFLFSALFSRNEVVSLYSFRAECFCLGLALNVNTTYVMEVVPVALRSNAVSIRILLATPLAAFFSSEVVGLTSDHFDLQTSLLIVGPTALIIGSIACWTLTALHLLEKSKAGHEQQAQEGLLKNPPAEVQPIVSA